MPHTLARSKSVVAIFTTLLVIMAFSMLILPSAHAEETQVYKWVDKNGTVSFGSQPPPSVSSKSMTVKTIEPSTPDEPPATDTVDSKNDKGGKKAKKQKANPAKPPVPQMSGARKRQICLQSQKDLAALHSRGRARQKNADGSLSYLTGQQIQERMNTDNRLIMQYCN